MRCPKCHQEQNNTVECDRCGVIFARYEKILERQREAERQRQQREGEQSSSPGRHKGLLLLAALLLVVAVAGGTYYFTVKTMGPQVAQQASPPASPAATPKPREVSPAQTLPQAHAPTPSNAGGEVASGNAIVRAKNATVSIETPWGTGSGFFVSKNYIVTNKHVVQFDDKKLSEMREKVDKGRRFFDLERQKIDEWKETYRKMPKGPQRSQLAMIIERHEEELSKALPLLQAEERRLEKVDRKVQPSDFKIILADGSSHTGNHLLLSPTYDLALLSLYSVQATPLEKPPSGHGLNQGDKVYAIGSPVGLRHTVTAGIFSGYRVRKEDGGQVFLQTDAAINPGNSGGPIVDDQGYARGVTTLVLTNTEGIGFAIPIEKVFEEFSSSLF